MTGVSVLPLELIFCVIASLLGDPRAILRPSHPTTKTLLSLTRVCRATYPVAANYLRQHCVYIDNDRRLRELIHCVESTRGWTQGSLTHSTETIRTYAPATPLRPFNTLYLAPFSRFLDDQPTAIWIRELFCLIGLQIKRLVVDIPLRSLSPADDHLDVRRTLREGFAELSHIEEFVSVRDELYLDVLEPTWRRVGQPAKSMAWTAWPYLRRLALYNVFAGTSFWADVRRLSRLETVVLTRADALREICLKRAYLGAGGAGMSGEVDASSEAEPRPLKVVLVNVFYDQPNGLEGQSRWDEVDPKHVVDVMNYDVPTSFYADEDVESLCQEWVKTAALRGNIWDWEGTPLRALPRLGQGPGLPVFPMFPLEA